MVAARLRRLPSVGRTGAFALLAFGVALVPRIGFVLRNGGFRGVFGYDTGVYYAAADALVHGRLPYRDYTLLHPPAIALVLAPFAEFGRLTTDHTGFMAATLAFCCLGAANAALVVVVARKAGAGPVPALVGGLVYAVWWGAAGSEYLGRLEPLGNFFLLLSLAVYFPGRSRPSYPRAVAAGALLGCAASVKIWFVVPLGVVLLWHAISRDWRRLGAQLAGVVGALLVVLGPFYYAAPHRMTHMLVTDQLGRHDVNPLSGRFGALSTAALYDPGLSVGAGITCAIVLGTLCLALVVLAVRLPGGRLPATAFVAGVLVLIWAPTYFAFYDDFYAAPLAITVAMGLASLTRGRSVVGRRPGAARIAAGVGAIAVAAAAACAVAFPTRTLAPFPARKLAPAVAQARCVMSDSPIVLIQLDVLSKGLENGCRNWVDATGRTYGVDSEYANGVPVPRWRNHIWQNDLTRYFESGDAFVLYRPTGTGIGRPLARLLRRSRVLRRADGVIVYRPPAAAERRGGRNG